MANGTVSAATNASRSTVTDPRVEFYVHTRYLMINVVSPIELILGTFGNVMVIVIFRRMKDNSSLSVYFSALAVSDTVFLYFGLGLFLWCRMQFSFVFTLLHSATCKLDVFLNYACSATSSWFLVAMTTQRAASVIWPHRVNVLCTRRASIITVCVIVIVIFSLYSHILYGFYVGTSDFLTIDCSFGGVYEVFYRKYWSWADIVIVSFAPFAVLLGANIVLLWKVVASVKSARDSLAAGQSGQVKAREKKTSSMTITLVSVSVAFFMLTSPIRVFLLVLPYAVPLNTAAEFHLGNLISDVVNLVFCSNSAINFYLYCLTGNRFRAEFLKLLSGLSRRKANNASCSQTSDKTLESQTAG